MKYAIVIPDGCADDPQESLGGRTPLQAARLPNMDRAARTGVVGRANNVPQPLTPASDVALRRRLDRSSASSRSSTVRIGTSSSRISVPHPPAAPG